MEVIFESCIKIDEKGDWFIELKDTRSERVEVCLDMDEYSQKVEEFGAAYGGEINEVVWSKDENVSPQVMDEIRLEMARLQQEIEAKEPN
jgi:hypothetical protein